MSCAAQTSRDLDLALDDCVRCYEPDGSYYEGVITSIQDGDAAAVMVKFAKFTSIVPVSDMRIEYDNYCQILTISNLGSIVLDQRDGAALPLAA